MTNHKATIEFEFDDASSARSALQKAEQIVNAGEEEIEDAEGEITSVRRTR